MFIGLSKEAQKVERSPLLKKVLGLQASVAGLSLAEGSKCSPWVLHYKQTSPATSTGYESLSLIGQKGRGALEATSSDLEAGRPKLELPDIRGPGIYSGIPSWIPEFEALALVPKT